MIGGIAETAFAPAYYLVARGPAARHEGLLPQAGGQGSCIDDRRFVFYPLARCDATRCGMPYQNNDDRRRERVILIHGTFAGHRGRERPKWWEGHSAFAAALSAEIGPGFEIDDGFAWGEGGANSEVARRRGADDLLRYLGELEQRGDCSAYHLVAHSHGGNVVWQALGLAAAANKPLAKLGSWTTVGTPFLTFAPMRWPLTRLLLLLCFILTSPFVVASVSALASEPAMLWRETGQGALSLLYALTGMFGLAALMTLGAILAHFVVVARRTIDERKRLSAERFTDRWLGIWHDDDEARALLAASLVRPPVLVPRFGRPNSGLLARLAGALTAFDWLFAPAGDQQAWRVVTGRAQGRDISEDLAAVTVGPSAVVRWWPALPRETQEQIREAADRSAALALREGRRQLNTIGRQEELGEVAGLFAGTASWQELIHTSYFDSTGVRALIAARVAGGLPRGSAAVRDWYEHGRVDAPAVRMRSGGGFALRFARALTLAPLVALWAALCSFVFASGVHPHTAAGLRERQAASMLSTPDLVLIEDGAAFARTMLLALGDADLKRGLARAISLVDPQARRGAATAIAREASRRGRFEDIRNAVRMLENEEHPDQRPLRIEILAAGVAGARAGGYGTAADVQQELLAALSRDAGLSYVAADLMLGALHDGNDALAREFLAIYAKPPDRRCPGAQSTIRQITHAGHGRFASEFAAACATARIPAPLIYRHALAGAIAFRASLPASEVQPRIAYDAFGIQFADQASSDFDLGHDSDPLLSINALLASGKLDAAVALTMQWLPMMLSVPPSRGHDVIALAKAVEGRHPQLAETLRQTWAQHASRSILQYLGNAPQIDIAAIEHAALDLLHLGRRGRIESVMEQIQDDRAEAASNDGASPCAALRATVMRETVDLAIQRKEAGGAGVPEPRLRQSGEDLASAFLFMRESDNPRRPTFRRCILVGVAGLALALKYDMGDRLGELVTALLSATHGEVDQSSRAQALGVAAVAEARIRTTLAGVEAAERISPTERVRALAAILERRLLSQGPASRTN